MCIGDIVVVVIFLLIIVVFLFPLLRDKKTVEEMKK